MLVGIGRIVLDMNEHSCFSGCGGFAEGEECFVGLVLYAPALVLEVCLVLRVLDDDLALRVDYLLLKLLQKLSPVPLASAEGREGLMEERRAQEEERQQCPCPY